MVVPSETGKLSEGSSQSTGCADFIKTVDKIIGLYDTPPHPRIAGEYQTKGGDHCSDCA